ncbi:MAG: DUF1289 domain-containing protein [Roseovarius sp.]|nr:DUF1289 domain-containing protein [Roseovarius sp.]MCY4206846.1 DUF1289 domain-containing protein [Roseovarius sp.]MCY4291219.1 DUF1289 domain-containing protein [Roseovarius sp.]MCY4314873.1 DUF1289 domain-containing protein [Roseovarius sp.]
MTENDNVWQRDEVDSPCLRICVIHPDAKICIGCHRTSEEIAKWSKYSHSERREIMDKLPGRVKLLRKRRGRRKALALRNK